LAPDDRDDRFFMFMAAPLLLRVEDEALFLIGIAIDAAAAVVVVLEEGFAFFPAVVLEDGTDLLL
jgi:hypothetical protein